MRARFKQRASEPMKLPVRDRVRLAEHLVSTLEDDTEFVTKKEVEELWFAEADRRLEELNSGTVQGVGAEEAFRNAREALK